MQCIAYVYELELDTFALVSVTPFFFSCINVTDFISSKYVFSISFLCTYILHTLKVLELLEAEAEMLDTAPAAAALEIILNVNLNMTYPLVN